MSTQIPTQINIIKISTKPYSAQKPGTSGLRKKVKQFSQELYTHNFIQSYFYALRKDTLSPKNTLLIGGDGRYFTKQAISIICQIACANGINELHIAKNGLMSTPACSAYIREQNRKIGNCIGGILLTASHNAGGKQQDFGIKFNSRNGGPTLQQFTNLVYTQSTRINQINSTNYDFLSIVDLTQIGQYVFTNVNRHEKPIFIIKIIQNVTNYVSLMKTQFDFHIISKLLQRKDFKFVFDAMHGAAGPYANQIFNNQLPNNSKLLNCNPLEDFGGLHPDPNLKCAQQLVNIMGLNSNIQSQYNLGAACDGDADRNMIVGNNFFVTPSDSLAVLAAHYKLFTSKQITGIARSMPTSGAVDKVAKKLGLNLYETPTGWKYFGNLMEENLIYLCGEESFGTGSSHIREKDGIWTILAWLQVIAKLNEGVAQGQLKGVSAIVNDFWKEYGRNYYCRYDFQKCEKQNACKVWERLKAQVQQHQKGQIKADQFTYHDPVDKSISENQGFRFMYPDGSRVVFRQSGTSSVGVAIRIYFQKYEEKDFHRKPQDVLKPIIDFGLNLSQICELTGKANPDVIT